MEVDISNFMKKVNNSNVIRLTKINNNYIWTRDKQKTDPMQKASAKAFGVWWLRIKRDKIDASIDLLDSKHNTAFFSSLGDFLYVDTI